MSAYYNEIDPYAAQWLRNLIAAGHIAPGDVDERSIVDVRPADVGGYAQCHFFAGVGGWSLAARLAGWPDDRPLWTRSCPCQPWSYAGRRGGAADARHLWPEWRRLLAECRPPVVAGEQVAKAPEWVREVRRDLEGLGYAVGFLPVEAACVGAPHFRDRMWFVADRDGPGLEIQIDRQKREFTAAVGASPWAAEPGVGRVAYGLPGRVDQIRAYGNAIVPQVAAEVIAAFMECRP